MFQINRRKNAVSDVPELYDVTVSFNRALSQARRERGEPDKGISRRIYDARLWAKSHPRKSARAGIALAGIGVGLIFFLARRRKRGTEEASGFFSGQAA